MKRRGGGEHPAVRKGPWTAEEDEVLLRHVREHGPREWSSIRSKGLLPRTGKSCRLRWVNRLRPDLKTGCKFSAEEERVVLELQAQFGNKWARIATYLPGRTDNDVKNFWSTRQKRLARLLRAPVPRRWPGKLSSGASSSHAYELLPAPKNPCMEMIPFQETMTKTPHHIGESSSSSQEPTTANHRAAAHFPGAYGLPPPPTPLPTMHAGAERGSSGATAPTPTTALLLPYYGGGTGSPVNGVDPLVFVDPAASPEPLEVVPPGPFFGLDDDYVHASRAPHRDMFGVRFDDLPPETFDFFELPHLPAFPPPFPPPPPNYRVTGSSRADQKHVHQKP